MTTTPDGALSQGRDAFRRHDWAEARRLLTTADADAPLEPDDLDRLATAAYLAGHDADSEAVRTRAHHDRLERGDREGAARSALWLAFGLLNRGARAPGAGWLARAGRLLDEHPGDSVVRGYLIVPQGIERIIRGDAAGSHDLFRQAAAIAGRFGDRDLAALAGHACGRALLRLGRIADGVALFDEAMVAVTAGDVSPLVAGDIYCSVLQGCHEIFDLQRAYEWTTSLAQWCGAQPGLVRYRGECLTYRAELRQLRGDWDGAMQDAMDACRLLSDPPRTAIGAAFYRRGEVHRLRGEFAEAEQAYRQAGQNGRTPQPGLSLLRLIQGQTDVARAAIQRVITESSEPAARAPALAAAVAIMLAADDAPGARLASDELREIGADIDAPFLAAASGHARGAVLLADGDAHSALVALSDACRIWRSLGTPYEEAETRVLVSLACRDLEDLDSRDLEMGAARETFRQLGAAPALARIAELSKPPSSMTAGGLSGREIQVLRLVAAGRTNRAIADALFISEKTVARHVSNIFNKLGVSSRSAATACAYQRHLV